MTVLNVMISVLAMILEPLFFFAFLATVAAIPTLILFMIIVLIAQTIEDFKSWKKKRNVIEE